MHEACVRYGRLLASPQSQSWLSDSFDSDSVYDLMMQRRSFSRVVLSLVSSGQSTGASMIMCGPIRRWLQLGGAFVRNSYL